MKFLCLAYGDEAGWNALTEQQKKTALDHDEVIKQRGNLVSPVKPGATFVRNWDGELDVSEDKSNQQVLPLAGFSIIEAGSIEEVIELVKNTPCAIARGFIEIRPFLA